MWQSTALAAVALLFGLPLGVAAGRWIWATFASSIGVATTAAVPVAAVLVAVPATLVMANLIAAAPGWMAGRVHPALVLPHRISEDRSATGAGVPRHPCQRRLSSFRFAHPLERCRPRGRARPVGSRCRRGPPGGCIVKGAGPAADSPRGAERPAFEVQEGAALASDSQRAGTPVELRKAPPRRRILNAIGRPAFEIEEGAAPAADTRRGRTAGAE